MSSFELSKLQAVTSPRALSDMDRTAAQTLSSARAGQNASATATSGAGISLEIGATVNTSVPPVDNDRVEQIRKALRDDSYPLVPAEIADAMIAAQVSFEIV